MQYPSFEPSFPNSSNLSDFAVETNHQTKIDPDPFHCHAAFAGMMEMGSDSQTVIDYLKQHQDWFPDCAKPMTVEPIGENGYLLSLGRFGALGFHVDIKLALGMEFLETGKFGMRSLPLPEPSPTAYDVDYKATMELREINPADHHESSASLAKAITQLVWDLKLNIAVQLPKFVRKLPLTLVQKASNRLLCKIVGQVSPTFNETGSTRFSSSFSTTHSFWEECDLLASALTEEIQQNDKDRSIILKIAQLKIIIPENHHIISFLALKVELSLRLFCRGANCIFKVVTELIDEIIHFFEEIVTNGLAV